MSSIANLYKKLNLEQGMSVTRALTAAGDFFATFSNPAKGPNGIIQMLGGKPLSNAVEADIVAKALIEQAVVLGEQFELQAAMVIAQAKLTKIRATMPYAFAGADTPVVAEKAAKRSERGGDKKVRARVVFDREQGKSSGQIAKIISTELGISYANAYYYVSRVFNKE